MTEHAATKLSINSETSHLPHKTQLIETVSLVYAGNLAIKHIKIMHQQECSTAVTQL